MKATPLQRKRSLAKFAWKDGDVEVQSPPNAEEVEQEISKLDDTHVGLPIKPDR